MRSTIIALLLGSITAPQIANGNPCPPPTVPDGSVCVLTADAEINAPIELGAFTTLDCKGHRIRPSAPGSGAAPENYVPSSPAMAVFMNGELSVEVRNCVLGSEVERFDFGIIAINSKLAGNRGHRIANNEIHARETGITLQRVDDARVSDNLITWTNGSGIRVGRNSDRNQVKNNVLSSPGAPPAMTQIVPGGAFFANADDGIVLASFPLQVLYNIVVNGQLYQFPNYVDGGYPANENNIVEGNMVSLPGSSVGKLHNAIYVANNETNARVIGNTVHMAATGIRLAGNSANQAVSRVAHCQDVNASALDRFCASNADCFIPGFDPAPIGTCPALQQDIVDLRAKFTVAEGNLLIGPFNSTIEIQRAAIFAGQANLGGIVRGNEVRAGGIEAGISITGISIESATVLHNRVKDAAIGILLFQGPATEFGACVAFNDIIGSVVRAVGVSGSYSLPTELSCNGSGNYWGHTKPPCFLPADSPDPALITDSHPYCRRAARP